MLHRSGTLGMHWLGLQLAFCTQLHSDPHEGGPNRGFGALGPPCSQSAQESGHWPLQSLSLSAAFCSLPLQLLSGSYHSFSGLRPKPSLPGPDLPILTHRPCSHSTPPGEALLCSQSSAPTAPGALDVSKELYDDHPHRSHLPVNWAGH